MRQDRASNRDVLATGMTLQGGRHGRGPCSHRLHQAIGRDRHHVAGARGVNHPGARRHIHAIGILVVGGDGCLPGHAPEKTRHGQRDGNSLQ